jgi:hypothetical protein
MRDHALGRERMTNGGQLGVSESARLARSSRLAAVGALIVFLALAALIGRNVIRLNTLEAQIDDRRNSIGELEGTVSALQNEVYSLRHAPEDRIVVRAHAEPLQGIMENGQQVKDFTIWIDLSTYRKKTLRRVTYRVGDDTAPFASRVTDNAANGFSISYRGSSCISSIILDVEFEDGTTDSFDFDMCKALEG